MGFLRSVFTIFTLFLSVIGHLGAKNPIKAICWDLCYTLCSPSSTSLLKAAGAGSYALYTNWDGKSKGDLRRCINGILAVSGPQKTTYPARDCYGTPYSQPMADLFLGKTTTQKVLDETLEQAKKLKEKHYFHNEREYQLCINILNYMLDPYTFAQSIEPCASMLSLLKEFSEKYDFYLGTLWDKESFAHLLKNKSMKKIFDYFPKEKRFISAEVGKVPSDPAFYQTFLEKYYLKPEECLVIDDQKENIEAAKACGMHAIHYQQDIKALRKEMERIL